MNVSKVTFFTFPLLPLTLPSIVLVSKNIPSNPLAVNSIEQLNPYFSFKDHSKFVTIPTKASIP